MIVFMFNAGFDGSKVTKKQGRKTDRQEVKRENGAD